jgi:hypothetical protein
VGSRRWGDFEKQEGRRSRFMAEAVGEGDEEVFGIS